MRIGELARQAGCEVETIRFYEKTGLIEAPLRNASGYRQYRQSHLERLQFIRHCRSLQMGLKDIQTLLALQANPAAGCENVNLLLDQHIAAIRSQMEGLRQLEHQLTRLRHQCHAPHAVSECGILHGLAVHSAPASGV